MRLIHRPAKTMALFGVVMRLDRDAIAFQRRDHVAGLLRHHHGIQFTLKEITGTRMLLACSNGVRAA
jgi:hypothetical protein